MLRFPKKEEIDKLTDEEVSKRLREEMPNVTGQELAEFRNSASMTNRELLQWVISWKIITKFLSEKGV